MPNKKNKKLLVAISKNFLKYLGSLIITPILSIPLFIVMIPFLVFANGLPDAQQADIGGQNMWRIVGFYGLFTLVIAGITFYKKRFRYLGMAFITYWVLGTIFVIFIGISNNSSNNISTGSDVVTNWNSCDEQAEIQEAKNCSFPIDTDQASGSSFAIEDQYLVTNFHVVNGANEIYTFTSDSGDTKVPLTLWGYSEKDDIAVLKIDQKVSSCKMISSDNLPLAETLYAVGWPLGLAGESSITKGTYSRKISTNGQEFIQTDTAINPGNSGGPLVSKCGIVGINQAIIRWSDSQTPAEGLGFAISSSHAKGIINNLINTGKQTSLPVGSSQASAGNYEPPANQNNSSGSTNYDVAGWESALNTTRQLSAYWNSSSVNQYDQGKVATIRDLLVRMSAVVENIVPKIERGENISSEENRLLGQWNSMYSQVSYLIVQVQYYR